MNRTLLSKIKIVDIDKILPFEWDFTNISDLIDTENIRHPLLSTEIDDGNYLLLENSELYYNCLKSGIKHLPLQTNEKEELEIISYHLGFDNFSETELVKLSEKYTEQIILRERPDNSLEKYIQVDFIFKDNPALIVWLRNSTSSGCPYPLELLFRVILNKSQYHQVIERRQRSNALTCTKSYDVYMRLPSFSLNDLIHAALSDRLFPPSIINIIPKCRIFNIDFPLSILASDISVEEKQAFLTELIALRVQTRKASYYTGQVFFLNR